LIEWLAYHYHVLNLRYLILAFDPKSQTSPSPILERWKPYMTILEWDDFKLGLKTTWRKTFAKIKNHRERHRFRQRHLYYQCLKHMKAHGRGWTLLWDSDEYIRINHPDHPNSTKTDLQSPPITEPGSVLTYINAMGPYDKFLSKSCVPIPRLRFGVYENTTQQQQQQQQEIQCNRNISFAVNASNNLQTLRWKYHADPYKLSLNKISKTMIHVGRLKSNQIKVSRTIHRPILKLCKNRGMFMTTNTSHLVLNHYLGTWEQYTYRQDARTGNERSLKVRTLHNVGTIQYEERVSCSNGYPLSILTTTIFVLYNVVL
jgi:hypothetical protein